MDFLLAQMSGLEFIEAGGIDGLLHAISIWKTMALCLGLLLAVVLAITMMICFESEKNQNKYKAAQLELHDLRTHVTELNDKATAACQQVQDLGEACLLNSQRRREVEEYIEGVDAKFNKYVGGERNGQLCGAHDCAMVIRKILSR